MTIGFYPPASLPPPAKHQLRHIYPYYHILPSIPPAFACVLHHDNHHVTPPLHYSAFTSACCCPHNHPSSPSVIPLKLFSFLSFICVPTVSPMHSLISRRPSISRWSSMFPLILFRHARIDLT